MTVPAPAAMAVASARVNEIRSRLGLSGAAAPAVPAVPAHRTAFASTLTRALTGGTVDTAMSAVTSAATAGRTGAAAGEQAVALATSYTGVPYLWGGTDPARGLDCSGLVQLVYRRLGVDLPRTSAQQAKVGTAVDSLADARPGDLVFFGSPVHHVGIYAGDGMMIDAPRRGKTVGLHKVWTDVTAIRRVTPDPVPPTATSERAALGGGSVTLPGGETGSIGGLLAQLVHAKAGTSSFAAAGTGTGTGTTTDTMTTTLNALLAAARGYGPGAPGGVMGSAGEHPVEVPISSGPRAVAPAGVAGTSAAAATGGPSAAGWQAQPYAELFQAAGRRYGVDPALLSAIAKAESGYRPTARSHAGAIGLMQLMPGTARELGVNPSRPAEAVDGAARLVARYLKAYDGDVDTVLAAYNAGPGAVRKYDGVPPYSETQTYVRRVTGYWKDLR